MELEQNHIDDIFRRRLYHTEAPPPAFVWENVENELRKRRRRRFLFWLFAFGIAGAGLWSTLRPAGTGAQAGREAPAAAQNLPAAIVAAPAQNRSGEPSAAAGLPAMQPATAPKDSPDGSATTARSAPAAKNIRVSPLQYATPASMSPGRMAEEMPSPASGTPAPEQTETTALLPATGNVQDPLVYTRHENLPQVKAPSFIRKKKDPKHCYDFNQNSRVWMADVYAGPLFSRRTLESASPASDPYRQMRSATETRDWAFNAGLRGSLLLGRHFIVRAGLHYEQMTEKFEYADPNYIKYIIEVTQKVIDGKLVTIIDTIGVEYGENYVRTFNRYGMLDVPLEIGGEIRRGRFGVSLNAGISFNVLFWKRGTVLSPAGQPTPFTPGERGSAEIYRSSAGWSAGASGQLFCHLQPRLRVFVEPYFRRVLRPVTLGDQPVQQRYHNWGIKIGATKILN